MIYHNELRGPFLDQNQNHQNMDVSIHKLVAGNPVTYPHCNHFSAAGQFVFCFFRPFLEKIFSLSSAEN